MVSLRGYILGKLGRTADAREVLSTLDAIASERYVPPYRHDTSYSWPWTRSRIRFEAIRGFVTS
jgi:hypothetical protein